MRLLTSISLIVSYVTAWTTGSAVSSFGGSVLLFDRPALSTGPSTRNMLCMKKGKANVPPQMRSQYAKQQEMMAAREQMIAASRPGPDGLPIFNLFVRTKRANVSALESACGSGCLYLWSPSTNRFTHIFSCCQMWYPCGSFKGDDRSAALAKSYADGGLLAGVSKKQIDTGIAGSLYRDQAKLADSICRAYPQLRKSRDEFEYGFKLAFEGLSDEQAAEIKRIEPKETTGFLDNIKSIFT